MALVSIAGPGVARAHAFLLSTAPSDSAVLATPPTQIRLWFSEPISLVPRSLEVSGPDGRIVPIEPPRVAVGDSAELFAAVHARQPGTYLVRWAVISADTHPVRGALTFSIGTPSPLLRVGIG